MLKGKAIRLCALIVVWLALAALPAGAAADEANRAGLVILFGDGRVESRCVAFEQEEITGAELLAHSGLHMIIDASRGMGITVCSIEGVGCMYPTEACFCQCMGGGACAYWNYFYRDPGETEWIYSALGAVLRKVRPGAVEAWVWGDGQTPPPADLDFEDVCIPPSPTPTQEAQREGGTGTPGRPTSGPVAVAMSLTETQEPTRMPTSVATATVLLPSPTPTATPIVGTGQTLISYWPFALMILGLALVGVFVWFRRA
jgi:hypothetical protein